MSKAKQPEPPPRAGLAIFYRENPEPDFWVFCIGCLTLFRFQHSYDVLRFKNGHVHCPMNTAPLNRLAERMAEAAMDEGKK